MSEKAWSTKDPKDQRMDDAAILANDLNKLLSNGFATPEDQLDWLFVANQQTEGQMPMTLLMLGTRKKRQMVLDVLYNLVEGKP